jgi:hypothetical protein
MSKFFNKNGEEVHVETTDTAQKEEPALVSIQMDPSQKLWDPKTGRVYTVKELNNLIELNKKYMNDTYYTPPPPIDTTGFETVSDDFHGYLGGSRDKRQDIKETWEGFIITEGRYIRTGTRSQHYTTVRKCDRVFSTVEEVIEYEHITEWKDWHSV